MAKSQENGTTILLGLKGYEVGKVSEEEKGIMVEVTTELKKPACPCCDSAKLYRHGRAKKGRYCMDGVRARRFTLSLLVIAGDARIVGVPSAKA